MDNSDNTIIKSIDKMLNFITDVKLILDLDEEEYSDEVVIDMIGNLVMEYETLEDE